MIWIFFSSPQLILMMQNKWISAHWKSKDGHFHLGNGFAANTAAALLSRPVAVSPYWRQEQQIIEAAVVAYDGNIARAAAALEISPSTIYRKRQAWSERMRAAS
jgi:DNA-binding NtrC family response regulator